MWRDIVGYEGLYQVSDKGVVRSVDRKTTGARNRMLKGRELKQISEQFNNGKYIRLVVDLCKNGRKKRHKVHRLVAEAFIPNPDGLPVINHIDLNPQNNSVDNLEWCDQSDNIKHANKSGHRTGHTSLTEAQKKEMARQYIPYSKENNFRAIGARFGVSGGTVRRAITEMKML